MVLIHFDHVLIDSIEPVLRGKDLFQTEPAVRFKVINGVPVVTRHAGLVYDQSDRLAMQVSFRVSEKYVESGNYSIHKIGGF